MKTVILAGGMGTRLAEETDLKPKPMIEIGGRPILWHVMQTYAAYGMREFVVCLGYRGEVIKDYFSRYYHLRNDMSVNLATGRVDVHEGAGEDWTVHLVGTGSGTDTGGRLKRVAHLIGGGTFAMTYGDGLGLVDVDALVAFHRGHGRLATVTAVRPPARFGGMSFDDDGAVTEFVEKPQIGEGWINGGYFVLEPGVLDYIEGDHTNFEMETLDRLAADGQLMAHRHDAFWQCVDTLRDVRLMNRLCEAGRPPWLR
ncbi:MAG TPA: glucose-1-phosphate cytidylyltransferase [Candidatus Dormibacteraeota bacterium]|nr:glucose-1-phosphate cytidylyltransferase [Candidatus Dormibacteraeota bacterium]